MKLFEHGMNVLNHQTKKEKKMGYSICYKMLLLHLISNMLSSGNVMDGLGLGL